MRTKKHYNSKGQYCGRIVNLDAHSDECTACRESRQTIRLRLSIQEAEQIVSATAKRYPAIATYLQAYITLVRRDQHGIFD